MRILYIYRHPDMGYSIARVFKPIENEMKQYAEVDSIYLPVPNYSIRGLWKNICAARKAIKQKHYDVVHITGAEHYLIPFLKGQKVVVTVHDIMYYSYLNGIKKAIWKYLFIYSLKYASYITFISSFSKKQVCNVLNIKKDNNEIIPNALDTVFYFSPKEFNEICPIILHIGSLPRKNLARTIEAIHFLKCKLRIIGKQPLEIHSLLDKYDIDYTLLSNLTDKEIVEEYKRCDIVNFVSLFEGFGMPIIEAQAMGRIVITSNCAPMNDVAGDGAVLVNPLDINDIRLAYQKVMTDSNLRNQIIQKGLDNTLRFKLNDIVNKYLRIYTKLNENSH